MTTPASPPRPRAATSCSIDTYRVSSIDVQQRILRALRRVDRPGVRALGLLDADGARITVRSEHLLDQVHADRVLVAMDRRARRTSSVTRRA